MKSFVVCFSPCPDCVTHFFDDKNESLGLNIQYVLFVFYFCIILELHTSDKPNSTYSDVAKAKVGIDYFCLLLPDFD